MCIEHLFFRRWATKRLNEYLVKGFTMDDDRLRAARNIGSDYFDELRERILDIRSSEKRFYQKIRDIYKMAVDYDPKVPETLEFFSIVCRTSCISEFPAKPPPN